MYTFFAVCGSVWNFMLSLHCFAVVSFGFLSVQRKTVSPSSYKTVLNQYVSVLRQQRLYFREQFDFTFTLSRLAQRSVNFEMWNTISVDDQYIIFFVLLYYILKEIAQENAHMLYYIQIVVVHTLVKNLFLMYSAYFMVGKLSRLLDSWVKEIIFKKYALLSELQATVLYSTNVEIVYFWPACAFFLCHSRLYFNTFNTFEMQKMSLRMKLFRSPHFQLLSC